MRFEHIEFLWFLAVLPLLIGLFLGYLQWRKRGLSSLGVYTTLKPLINGYIPKRVATKFILLLASLVCFIIALANPQKKDETVTIQRKGIDLVYAVDISKSMLATDIAPNRLERAKQTIKRSLDIMRDNRVGLVVFAGRAYLQVPITVDYNALKMYVDNLHPDMISQQGTVLSDALELANNCFSENEEKYKAIVLISDGEDHDNSAISTAEKIAKDGTVVYTIGVGDPNGSVLIDPQTGAAKKDQNDQVVVSKLNEATLKDIAAATKGGYLLLNNINTGAEKILAFTENMEQNDLGSEEIKAYKSYFQYFLSLGLLCMIIGMLLPSAYKNRVL